MAERTIAEITAELKTRPITREFTIERDALVDDESRTVSLAFASDKAIDHYFGRLILSMDKKAMRTERLSNGAPLLLNHDWNDQIGVIEDFRIDGGIARANVRFSRSARGEEIYQDVKDGIRKSVSVGFMVYELDLETEKKGESPIYRSNDWEPYEISIVSVPADISVGVGRSMPDPAQVSEVPQARAISIKEENNTMTPEEIAAARAAENSTPAPAPAAAATPSPVSDTVTRTREIVAFAEIFGEAELARTMLAASPDVSIDDVRTAIRAKQSTPTPTPAPMAPQVAAERQGGVQLAVTVPRHGAIRSFKGERAAEKAYRFGKFLLGGPLGRGAAAAYCQQNGIMLKRDQAEGDNESGGYLVPEEFGNDLIDLRETYGIFRRNTKIVPMSSDVQSDPRRTGGLTAVFEGEADTGDVSTLGWDRVSLTAKKLMVLARYSSEISEDSLISMADTLANEMAYAFANKEDECGFNGDGTSTYGGIVGVRNKLLNLSATRANIAGLVVGSGNLYSELALVDFEAVVGKLPEYADTPMAKWFVSRSFYYNVMVKVALAAGGNAASDIESTRAKRFLGYDVEFTQVMPKVEANDQVCAILGDLSKGARMGTRRGTTISLSEHVLHSTDQIQVRGTERFDINVHDVGNQSATAALREAGPIVGLLTAAS
jgi:HK97 family phage major capsid protein/HK97 family phage prohead protease